MANLASLTDRFWATGNESYASALSGTILAGAATVPVNSAAAYVDGDLCAITVEPGTANQATFIGTKSGSSFVNCVWTEGNTGVGHSSGAAVIDYSSATHQAALVKGLLIQHNQDGTHKAITAPSITTTGNASFGGTLGVTGASTLTGGVTIGNTVAQFKDQSGNTVDVDPVRRNEGYQGRDYVASGLNPTASAGLVVTIPAGVYYRAGKRYSYAGGTKTLGASKDCYLDIDDSQVITSVEVAIGAVSGMTLTSNSQRFAKVVTSGAAVTTINYSGYLSTGTLGVNHAFDPLGNYLRNTDPQNKVLQALPAQVTTGGIVGTDVDLTGATAINVVVPSFCTMLKIRASMTYTSTVLSDTVLLKIKEGATVWGFNQASNYGTGGGGGTFAEAEVPVVAGSSHTFKCAGARAAGTGTVTMGLQHVIIEVG